MGGRETRIPNIEHRILNGEAEIGGVLRGGWFNRFLDKPAAAGKLGMTRTGGGNLAHSASLRTCFGWGVRRENSEDRIQETECGIQTREDGRERMSNSEYRTRNNEG